MPHSPYYVMPHLMRHPEVGRHELQAIHHAMDNHSSRCYHYGNAIFIARRHATATPILNVKEPQLNILLVYPRWNYPTFVQLQEPLGLFCIGASLKQAGHEVRAFDLAIDDIEELDTAIPQAGLVGIGSSTVLYGRACLLLDRELGPTQILEHRFGDPEVRALVDKIEMVLDPEVNRLYGEAKEMDLRMHSAVEIALRDGRILDSGIVERAADRWDRASLIEKFRWLVGHVMEADQVEAVLQAVLDCENLPSTRRLTGLLA